VIFDGVYVLEDASGGAVSTSVSAIAFANGVDYWLKRSSCDDAACVDIGKFDFDEDTKNLTLTDQKTGAQYSYSIEVLSTAPSVAESAIKIQGGAKLAQGGPALLDNMDAIVRLSTGRITSCSSGVVSNPLPATPAQRTGQAKGPNDEDCSKLIMKDAKLTYDGALDAQRAEIQRTCDLLKAKGVSSADC
jgi:hypothetical protein